MVKLETGTWVLVADSEKALILVNEGSANHPALRVQSKRQRDNPPDREQSASKPGRMNDGPSMHRSALDDTDWHELEKSRFAADISDLLYDQAHKGSFSSIVLVAAPQTLGEIRHQLHPEVLDKVIGEIPKVLTNQPTNTIARQVLEALNERD